MEVYGRYPSLYSGEEPSVKKELELLAFFSRVGDFAAAQNLWNKKLSTTPLTFLKVVTYADCIFNQSRYGDTSDFLKGFCASGQIPGGKNLMEDQLTLLRLIRAYCEIKTKGRLRAALKAARDFRRGLLAAKTSYRHYNEVQIHAIELYAHIIKFARVMSSFTTLEDHQFPFDGSAPGIWIGFEVWHTRLQESGLYWQALSIIKIFSRSLPPEWSESGYQSFIDKLETKTATSYIKLLKVAATAAYGRYLSWNGQSDCAQIQAKIAKYTYQGFLEGSPLQAPRQLLEVELVHHEAFSSGPDPDKILRELQRIAELCKVNQEHGLEIYYLEEWITKAIPVMGHEGTAAQRARLEKVQGELVVDIPSLLTNIINFWRPELRREVVDILSWFEKFDQRYPISPILLGDPDNDPDFLQWDIPLPRFRGELLKHFSYLNLGSNPIQGRRALRNSQILWDFLPMDAFKRLPVKWMLEWMLPQKNGDGTLDVLLNRLKSCFGDEPISEEDRQLLGQVLQPSNSSQGNHSPPDIMSLDGSQLQQLFFALPIDQEIWERRISALQLWFSNNPLLREPSANHYLIVNLLIMKARHLNFGVDTRQKTLGYISDNTRLYEYIEGLPEGLLKKSLRRDYLLAKTAATQAILGQPDLPTERLHYVRDMLIRILDDYKTSDLAGDTNSIASICFHLGRVAYMIHSISSLHLKEMKMWFREAEGLWDEERGDLSAFKVGTALELKTNQRRAPGMVRYLSYTATFNFMQEHDRAQRLGDEKMSENFAYEVWNHVQKGKARALNDMLSSSSIIPRELLDRIGRNPESKELFNQWRAKASELKGFPKTGTTPAAIAKARSQLREIETQMGSIPVLREVISLCQGKPIMAEEIRALPSLGQEGVILVDWYCVGGIIDEDTTSERLCMIIWRVGPQLERPKIFTLEPGILQKAEAWIVKYLNGGDIHTTDADEHAYAELQNLTGLVQPLAEVSERNDLLVFCPTSPGCLHRLPFHALEIPVGKELGGAETASLSSRELLYLRNRIVYTYSMSLLRLYVNSREKRTSPPTWRARLFDPLAPADDSSSKLPRNKYTGTEMSHLADVLPSSYHKHKEVTRSCVLSQIENADFVQFLGHVCRGSLPSLLTTHLVLYEKGESAPCSPNSAHELEASLTGADIIDQGSLGEGAHVSMICCGSGITDSLAIDEPLGLVPAFMFAGARSVVATLWDTKIEHARSWTKQFNRAWAEEEENLRESEEDMFDLASCFQTAGRKMLYSYGQENLAAWAGYVYHGYWKFPRKPRISQ
ncbi:MAG: hypothetical protein M1813_006501 [Trichoglossum hirsutum]|nr:MAG: hypothetical protein M1813_006501 [Trichoglossum hirsutum]